MPHLCWMGGEGVEVAPACALPLSGWLPEVVSTLSQREPERDEQVPVEVEPVPVPECDELGTEGAEQQLEGGEQGPEGSEQGSEVAYGTAVPLQPVA